MNVRAGPRQGLPDCLLSETGGECRIGALQLEKDGSVVSCQLVGIGVVDGFYLVAVPHAAWHRTGARRYLPNNCLTRAVLAEVLAASEADRKQPHPVWKVKAWIGLLSGACVESVTFSGGGEATAFGAGDEGAEVVFVVAGSGGTSAGPSPVCPLGASLTAVASEHFAFHSAHEYEEEAMPADRTTERLQAVESAISELKAGIQTLLDRKAGGNPAPETKPGGKEPEGTNPGVGAGRGGGSLPGLDPAVLRSARMAGVPE